MWVRADKHVSFPTFFEKNPVSCLFSSDVVSE
jgi:hypothetical protein